MSAEAGVKGPSLKCQIDILYRYILGLQKIWKIGTFGVGVMVHWSRSSDFLQNYAFRVKNPIQRARVQGANAF